MSITGVRLPFALVNPLDSSWVWVQTKGVRVLIIVLVAVAVSFVGRLWIRRFRRRLEGTPDLTQAIDLKRTTTIVTTVTNAVRVLVWGTAGLFVLAALGIDLAPLLAGASILGVALGFGAQSLVRDFLTGFFILVEDQFGVGDSVEVAVQGSPTTVTGRVESFGLRHTTIRGPDGTLSTTGNGNVLLVRNLSRGRGLVDVEVRVPKVRDYRTVEESAEQAVRDLREDSTVKRMVTSGPDYVAVEPTGGDDLLVRVQAETRPAKRSEVERELQRRLNRRLLSMPRGDGD
jgi:moderate conductance mechanosensitive channel